MKKSRAARHKLNGCSGLNIGEGGETSIVSSSEYAVKTLHIYCFKSLSVPHHPLHIIDNVNITANSAKVTVIESSSDDDEDKPIYNPLNLPLGYV